MTADSSPAIMMVLGTRPEIIKLSPVIRECERTGIPYSIVHTGQHYSDDLDAVFFDQLELPSPDYNLEVGSKSHGQQTAEMIAGIEGILLTEEPDVVLVQGDTNSVLAGVIATSRLDIELGHVEAGLRSFNRGMPEETNRVLADHAADYLFAPTDTSAKLLQDEGLEENVYITGNTVVDAIMENRQLAVEKSSVLADLGLQAGEFAVLTAHRAENIDNLDQFADILDGISRAAAALGLEVVYPVHPRADERVDGFSIPSPENIRFINPLDYLDFLRLEANAAIVMTDSGGVQEEACILGVPCVTFRDPTERPETVTVGANKVVGTDPQNIVDGAIEMISTNSTWENPFGDGTAAEQILGTLTKEPSQVIPS